MKQAPVVFFDSGVGGLPYLKLAREWYPSEDYVYVADSVHYPLGDKGVVEIQEAVVETFSLINSCFKPKLAVIACNTASVAALAQLRQSFSFPFVGVVPAVKPAAQLSRTGSIGILATPQTTQNDYLTMLVTEFARSCQVIRISAPRLRDFIEYRFFDASSSEKQAVLAHTAQIVRESQVDVVVLACTHYLFVEDELRALLGKEIMVIDSREGVVRQMGRLLAQVGKAQGKGSAGFFYTGDLKDGARHLAFCRLFGLKPKGRLGC